MAGRRTNAAGKLIASLRLTAEPARQSIRVITMVRATFGATPQMVHGTTAVPDSATFLFVFCFEIFSSSAQHQREQLACHAWNTLNNKLL